MTRNRLDGVAGSRTATPTDEVVSIECGLVIRSVGFRAKPMADAPFDLSRGIVPNLEGRILQDEAVLPGLYVAGWMKRGSNGVIGTNRACGVETARSILADLSTTPSKAASAEALAMLLAVRKRDFVGYHGWRSIDVIERENGLPKGKPREKLTRMADLLAASRATRPSLG
jgi:ferredoxin--NADP+ reductase